MVNKLRVTLAVAIIAVSPALTLPCRAQQRTEEDHPWENEEPREQIQWFELTEQGVKEIMRRLEENDPNKADELTRLRETNPQEFRDELKLFAGRYLLSRWGDRRIQMMEHAGRRRWRSMRSEGPGRWKEPDFPPPQDHRGPGALLMAQKFEEFREWLEQNRPEEANELERLKDTESHLYRKQAHFLFRKYRRIIEAAQENPELAELLEQDLELSQRRDELLARIRSAENDSRRREMIGKLEEILEARYEIILKRKQIRFQKFMKELEQLREDIKENEARLEKWKQPEYKNQSIKKRLIELLGKVEEFKWE